MNMFTRIARLVCQFEDFCTNSFGNIWQWKLDPYQLNIELKAEITICRRINEEYIRTEALPSLERERSGFFLRSVFRLPNEDTLWTLTRAKTGDILLSYQVSKNWDKITLLCDNTQSAGMVAFEYLTQMIPGVLLNRRYLSFHSALMEYEGKAFAICADSGIGKTTHARLWRDVKNALVLNGDRTICGKSENEWMAYGSPWSGTSGEQVNRCAPLKALVILERDTENRVRRLDVQEALPLLLMHLQFPKWEFELVEKALDELDSFLENIPVFRLKCRPDAEAVEVLENALVEVW